jgi:hypothetical protein
MYLLYLDDSGSVGNAEDSHIILAGVAVFERQTHWLSEGLDRIATRVRSMNMPRLRVAPRPINGAGETGTFERLDTAP